MSKCECWHATPNRKWVAAECWGTRERDACSCGGDQMKCDFYPEIREKAAKSQSRVLGPNSLMEKFWHDAKQEPPQQDGRYLVCYNIVGNITSEVVNYALDLAEAQPIDFENDHRPGWYEYDSEYGYVECNNVLCWADIPTVQRMIAKSGPDISIVDFVVMAPIIVLIVCAVLRQVLL